MAKREEWLKNKKRNYESSIADIVQGTVKPFLDKNSKVEVDLLLNWNKIFDKDLANKISFGKISFTNRKANKFILHVNVKPVDFLEVTHSTGVIKEQLNLFLGFQGCEAIKVNKN